MSFIFNKIAGIIKFIFKYLDKKQDIFIRYLFSYLEGTPRLEVLKFLISSLDKLLTIRVF